MKKFGSLLLSLVFFIMLPAAAMAEAKIGGNLRVCYNLSGADDTDTFEFDRLAIKFKSFLSEDHGFHSEVQFRNPGKNNPSGGDIRLENAYYYQTNIFGRDELNIGYIPITWHADKSMTILRSLASNLMAGNSVGIKYRLKGEEFSITGSVTNAANEQKSNSHKTGYDLGIRGEFSPATGLTLGAGVCNDIHDAKDEHSILRIVVDGLYSWGALELYGEFVSLKETVYGNSKDAENGFYIEGNYALTGNFTAYTGITSAKDLIDDHIVIGGKYQLTSGTALQGEYVDTKNADWGFSLRVRVDF